MTTSLSIGRLVLLWQGPPETVQPAALRLASERWLSALNLNVPGLSGGTVVVVRRLSGLPPLRGLPSLAWEQLLRDRIADLALRAPNPAREPVAPDALCVRFDDPAQMVALLTLDLWRNIAREKWYWRQWLPTVIEPPASAVAEVWSSQSRWLPAALELLPVRAVAGMLARFSRREISRVVHALHTEYVLPGGALDVMVPELDTGALADQTGAPPEPPWVEYSPEVEGHEAQTLIPQAQYLIGLCATLRRNPAAARQPVFAERAARWLRAALVSMPDIPSAVHQKTPQMVAQVREIDHQQPAAQAELAARESDRTSAPSAAWLDDVRLPFPTEGVETLIGGVLFLINLLDWLGLLDDGPESVAPWALIAALARDLLNVDGADYTGDPLWDVLNTLDSTVSPDAALPPPTFRLRPAWLRLDPRETRRWLVRVVRDRLVIWDDEAGYVVLDEPLAGRAAEQVMRDAAQEFAAHGDVAITWSTVSPPTLLTHESSHAAWWSARLMSFVRLGLVTLLGLAETPGATITGELLARSGRVLVSRTHIDLFAPLDEVRITVRRAGLDRDPGWVPSLGYIVLFHYI